LQYLRLNLQYKHIIFHYCLNNVSKDYQEIFFPILVYYLNKIYHHHKIQL
jgi:hypothetical protein